MIVSDVEITPEAIIGGGRRGWHVIAFTGGGYYVIGKEPDGSNERMMPVFRSAPDAEACIVQAGADLTPGASGQPVARPVSDAELLQVCRIALAEGVRWYAVNPPTAGDFEAQPLGHLIAQLHG